jgi:serine O-acetyltransferase
MKHEILKDSEIVANGSTTKRWQLDRIVAELRVSREETHSIRRDGEARRALLSVTRLRGIIRRS